MNKEQMTKIAVVWDKKDHIYKIEGSAQAEIDKFILANTCIEEAQIDAKTGKFVSKYIDIEKITDDEMYKVVYKKRTNLNNKSKEIAKKRKMAVAIMINDFQNYCKEIESQLDCASDKLTALLNEYKPKEKTVKPPVYELKIKTTDIKLYEKVKQFALDIGLKVEE